MTLNNIVDLEAFFLNDESPCFEEILFHEEEKALEVAKNRLDLMNVEYDENVLIETIRKIRAN